MNQSALLCIALAALSYCASAVVYGQLSVSQKDSCLLYGFHADETSNKINLTAKKGGTFKSINQFLQASQIALEISYVKVGTQFHSDFEAPNSPATEELKPKVLAKIIDNAEIQSVTELKPVPISVKPVPIIQNELSNATQEIVATEDAEKPSLRMPIANQ